MSRRASTDDLRTARDAARATLDRVNQAIRLADGAVNAANTGLLSLVGTRPTVDPEAALRSFSAPGELPPPPLEDLTSERENLRAQLRQAERRRAAARAALPLAEQRLRACETDLGVRLSEEAEPALRAIVRDRLVPSLLALARAHQAATDLGDGIRREANCCSLPPVGAVAEVVDLTLAPGSFLDSALEQLRRQFGRDVVPDVPELTPPKARVEKSDRPRPRITVGAIGPLR